MKRLARIFTILFALALVAAACGSDDEATDTGASTDESTEASTDEAMEEDDAMEDDDAMEEEAAVAPTVVGLEITSINFDTAEVVIVNNGDTEVNLDGHFLCNFPDYAPIADVGTVAPGESVTVISPVGISAAAGELGLYTTDSYSSPDAIQAYVEWGSPNHERSSVAIEAGIWDGTPLTADGNMLTIG